MSNVYHVTGRLKYMVWKSDDIDVEVEAGTEDEAIENAITEEYPFAEEYDSERLVVTLVSEDVNDSRLTVHAPEVLRAMATKGLRLERYLSGAMLVSTYGAQHFKPAANAEIATALELAGYIQQVDQQAGCTVFEITERGRKAAARQQVAV